MSKDISAYLGLLEELIDNSRQILFDLPIDKSWWTDRQRAISDIVDRYDAYVLLDEVESASPIEDESGGVVGCSPRPH